MRNLAAPCRVVARSSSHDLAAVVKIQGTLTNESLDKFMSSQDKLKLSEGLDVNVKKIELASLFVVFYM